MRTKTVEELQTMFNSLKTLLQDFENPLEGRSVTGKDYDLWSVKDLTIDNRPRKEVFFAGIRIQRNYVGFYYMPVYVEKELVSFFSANLLKLLKGKSCFHIKNLDEGLFDQIRGALQKGIECYKARGWI